MGPQEAKAYVDQLNAKVLQRSDCRRSLWRDASRGV